MQIRRWQPLTLLLIAGLLGGCKGTVTSSEPLLAAKDASFPVPSGTEITGQKLDDQGVWEGDERKATILLVDGSYRVIGPDQSGPSPDSFLFKQIDDGQFIVQASNGSEWAYGLIVRADMYYLFTFNRDDQNCTKLSAGELAMLHATIAKGRCYVSSLSDLVRLLWLLREKYPNPTSAFIVHETARSVHPAAGSDRP